MAGRIPEPNAGLWLERSPIIHVGFSSPAFGSRRVKYHFLHDLVRYGSFFKISLPDRVIYLKQGQVVGAFNMLHAS